MAVIDPVGERSFNSWRQHGHVDASPLSESRGEPPTVLKATPPSAITRLEL